MNQFNNQENGNVSHDRASSPIAWVREQGTGENSVPKPSNWVPVQEAPLYTERKMRVITIGAGFSGLMVAHKVN